METPSVRNRIICWRRFGKDNCAPLLGVEYVSSKKHVTILGEFVFLQKFLQAQFEW